MPEDDAKGQPPNQPSGADTPNAAGSAPQTESQIPESSNTYSSSPTESSSVNPETATPAEPASSPGVSGTQPETNDGFVAGTGPSLQTETEAPSQPQAVVSPSVTVPPAAPLAGFVSGSPSNPAAPPTKPKKSWLLPALIAGGLAVLIAAFFGFKAYTSSPNYVWNKSMENTQKAYATLDTQLNKMAEYKGSAATGKLTFTTEETEISGDFKAKSSGDNADIVLDLDMTSGDSGGNAIKLSAGMDIRMITENGYDDIYIRVRDLDKVASLLTGMGMSSAEVNSIVSQYNNQWYVLKGEYLAQLSSSVSGGTATTEQNTPSTKEIYALMNKLGKVSSEHIFASEEGKAVLVQKEFVAKEQKNNRATYHYKASVNKEALKAYGQELKKTLAEDASARSLMSVKDKAEAEKVLVFLDDLSKDFNESKTAIDIWVDSGTKLIQTVRLSDPKDAKSYLEVSQLYSSGDALPFQVVLSSADSKLTAKMTLDGKKNEVSYDIKAASNGGNMTFTAVESYTNTAPKIEKPANAKSVEELLNSYMGMLTQNQVQTQMLTQQYLTETQTLTN